MLVRSYAKINLFLKIIGKRSDGFHDLISRFQTIDLHDELYVDRSPFDHFSLSDPALPSDDRNLVIRARDLFRKETGYSEKLSIRLEKKIPSEAGLGGGSSNAAAMLRAMKFMSGIDIDLHPLAAQLGSDVNFFLVGGTALCKGRGEVVEPEADLPKKDFWIIKPSFGCPTKMVYQNLSAPYPDSDNQLESAAFIVEPRLKKLKDDLKAQGFQNVTLCGSGSSFFCEGEAAPRVDIPAVLIKSSSLSRKDHDSLG